MKIIKQGKLKNKKLSGTCSNCGCKIECEENECLSSPDQREPGLYITCPTIGCNRTIWTWIPRQSPLDEYGR